MVESTRELSVIDARKRTRMQRDAGTKAPIYETVEIPEELGPVQVLVDDDRIKTFAFTQDDYGEWYFGPSPFGDRIGHAAVLANDILNVYYTAYDRHRVVGVHTEEELWFRAPVFAEEEATITGRYVEKYKHADRGYVVMEAEARGADDRLLVRHRGTEIMRIDPGPLMKERRSQSRPQAKRITGRVRNDLVAVERAGVELETGTPIEPLVKHVTMERMAVFSFIGEFQRNIHSDLEVAKAGGLDLPICQGQQQACFVAELMTRFFGASWFTSGHQRTKFVRPLPAETEVRVGGSVSHLEVTPEGPRLHVEVWIDRGGLELTTVGWASALVGDAM